jgi:hypothetical protein
MTASKPGLSSPKPRAIRYPRKQAALMGNRRAWKTGEHSAAAKAAAKEAREKAWREEELRHLIWRAPIEEKCRAQHARIIDELKKLRQERERDEALAEARAAHLREVVRTPTKC